MTRGFQQHKQPLCCVAQKHPHSALDPICHFGWKTDLKRHISTSALTQISQSLPSPLLLSVTLTAVCSVNLPLRSRVWLTEWKTHSHRLHTSIPPGELCTCSQERVDKRAFSNTPAEEKFSWKQEGADAAKRKCKQLLNFVSFFLTVWLLP